MTVFDDVQEIYRAMEKESVPCSLCGCANSMPFLNCDRYGMGISTVVCRQCGFIFTNPRPTEQEMKNFYERAYRLFYTDNRDPQTDYERTSPQRKRAERLCQFITPELQKLPTHTPSVLDVGCGSGILLEILHQNLPSSTLHGVEPDQDFAEYARQKNRTSIHTGDLASFLDQMPAGHRFDLIILNHVLEHLYDPLEQLSTLRNFLPDQRFLLIEVPDVLSTAWRNPLDMFHIAHLSHFSPSTLERLLRISGFSVVKKFTGRPSINPWAMIYFCRKTDTLPPKQELSVLTPSEFKDLQTFIEKMREKIARLNNPNALSYRLRNHPLTLSVLKAASYLRNYGVRETAKKAFARLGHAGLQAMDPVRQLVRMPRVSLERKRNEPFLKSCIQNEKILIIGSGPSVATLDDLPEDLRIFTCNRGLKLLIDKGYNRQLDLYLCTLSKIKRFETIETSLSKIKTKMLLTDDLKRVQANKVLASSCDVLLYDDGEDNFFLKDLVKPYRWRDIRGRAYHPWTSSGIRLLQYALYYGAKEIYLAGIDFGDQGYFWGKNDGKWLHKDIDENFMKIISEKYDHVYSLAKNSPATRYVRYKNLERVGTSRVRNGK